MRMLTTEQKKRIKTIAMTCAIVYTIGFYSMAYVPGIPNPFETANADGVNRIGGGDDTNDNNQNDDTDSGIDTFDAQTFIASNFEQKTGHRLHLYAFPGHEADLYRDFAIYIFVDEEATFLIKIDDQKVDEGTVEWRHIYRSRSEYNYMDVTVIVKDKDSDAERTFTYDQLDLLDSPWQAEKDKEGDEEEDKTPEIAKPYISMGQGEFTIFVLLRVIADVTSAFFAVLIAMKYAAIKTDMAGTQRLF